VKRLKQRHFDFSTPPGNTSKIACFLSDFEGFFWPFFADLPDILRNWAVKKLRIFLRKKPLLYLADFSVVL
jgi:hypothetical protein